MEVRDDRLPLPSEDGGDLVDEPPEGRTDDPLVATAEGVPYVPRMERVMSESRGDTGVDVAGTDPTDAGELERTDMVQPPDGKPPRDGELEADVIERLRSSNVVAGYQIRVAAEGARVVLRGEVETFEILHEVLGMVGDVPGVEEVVDEVRVTGA